MFDTHCHLNFSAFNNNIKQVIDRARAAGVNQIMIPGTDYESSKKAVEIAEQNEGVYAAVGIHPHHVFQINQKRSEVGKIRNRNNSDKSENSDVSGLSDVSGIRLSDSPISSDLSEIEKLLSHHKVVAAGEIGIDRHYYQKTKYQNYQINEELIELQKLFFLEQIELAKEYKKTLIIHNREAKNDLLHVLTNNQSLITNNRIVFHCCEPDEELLRFAKEHNIFIGVDGDVTYDKKKQEFVKKIPLELLVLETDSPYLLPEPLRSQKQFPNEPKNLRIITEYIANLLKISINQLIEITMANAKRLFLIRN